MLRNQIAGDVNVGKGHEGKHFFSLLLDGVDVVDSVVLFETSCPSLLLLALILVESDTAGLRVSLSVLSLFILLTKNRTKGQVCTCAYP